MLPGSGCLRQTWAARPQSIAAAIKATGVQIERMGLDAGLSSAPSRTGLFAMGRRVTVIDATAYGSEDGLSEQDRPQRLSAPDFRAEVMPVMALVSGSASSTLASTRARSVILMQ
jgi:hypothetical protein